MAWIYFTPKFKDPTPSPAGALNYVFIQTLRAPGEEKDVVKIGHRNKRYPGKLLVSITKFIESILEPLKISQHKLLKLLNNGVEEKNVFFSSLSVFCFTF